MSTVRQLMVSIGDVYAEHANLFDYSEGSDRTEIFDLTYEEMLARLDAGESITGDCSSTYEATRKFAGCISLPPLGYTGSELETMPHISLAEALPGDAIVFGAFPGKHVVWITEANPTNPKIQGHGEPGFTRDTLLELWRDVFPGQPITVLSLSSYLPKTPPIPEEDVMAVAATVGNDGKVHVFQETTDGTVYGSTQETAGGAFAAPFVVMKNGKKP